MRTFFGSKLLHMVCMCLATLSASGSSMGDELIGLVLAGGGARGLAHIGVINALEDLQVPVHAVTGTSMGALVGGFYATGMTGGELQELVASMDWGRAFRDTKDRPYLPQRRKSEDYDYPSKTRLEFADGSLSLPLGLLEGQQAQVMIKSKLQGAESVDDFDLLPRKFRAVATDISTGKPVVLRRGDLGTAMRASMSIPGLLAPVEIDGQLLVDGGASMNIPVLPAQSIEVDRLIVVDIGSHLMNLGEIGGMVAVAEQLVKLMTRRNSLEQLELMGTEDILVSPDVEHINALDFDKADELIDLG